MQLEVYEAAIYSDGEPRQSETGAAAAEKKAESPKIDYVLFSWLVLFVFGGGLLALYYGEIGYFPEFTWQDSLTYLALMAITGGSLAVAYLFLLVVPGAIWSKFLISDPDLEKLLTHHDGCRRRPCVIRIMKRLVFPFALFMVHCHALLVLKSQTSSDPLGILYTTLGMVASLVAVSALLWRDLGEEISATPPKISVAPEVKPAPGRLTLAWRNSRMAKWLATWRESVSRRMRQIAGWLFTVRLSWHRVWITLCHLPVLLVYFLDVPSSIVRAAALAPLVSFLLLVLFPPNRRKTSRSLLCQYALAFGIAAALSLMSILVFYRLEGGQAPPSLLVVCTVVVVIANLVVALLFGEQRIYALTAGFLAALLLLGVGSFLGGASLPSQIMAQFGFGERTATLVVTEQASRLLDQLGVKSRACL